MFVDSTTVFVSTLDITSPSSVRLCQGSAVQLMVSGAATYRWTPSDGLSDPTIPNPIASPRVSTTYEIAGVDAFGCEDRTLLTVDVVDTASVVLRASTISAEAGTDDLGIPVVVEVDPELLPMFADTLMASLIFPAEVFYPSRWDIGQPFFSIRGNERVTRLLQHNIQLVNPQQRINTLYGTVLSGSITTATLHWEDIHWAGLTCPSNGSTPSLLLVTGCNIKGRALRYFSQTSVTAVPRPSSSVIDVSISGDEPGQYVVQLVSTDGAMIHQHTISRAYQSANVLSYPIDMSSIARGLYYVVVTAPSGPYLSRVLWMP